MNLPDPNREALGIVSERLEPRLDEFLFVGGAAVGLLLTDPAARRPRISKDVDVVVRVATLSEYSVDLRGFLVERGFEEDSSARAPLCRWIVRGVWVDVMPDDESIIGFSNRWFREGFTRAESFRVEQRIIRYASAAYFLAMKLEAFANRGKGDYYGSDDIEDTLTVIDGRPEVVQEVVAAERAVGRFISEGIRELLADSDFLNALPGHLDQGRDSIVLERLREMARSRERP